MSVPLKPYRMPAALVEAAKRAAVQPKTPNLSSKVRDWEQKPS